MSDHTDTTQDFLNPMIDYVFKKIFGREDHKAILIRFLIHCRGGARRKRLAVLSLIIRGGTEAAL